METKVAIIRNPETSAPTREPIHEHVSGSPCPCGCAPCEESCCTLECQVQPRFFCGQLLTDADLNQLLAWSKAKFRLKRYLQGWGVVCGLEAGLDPQRPDHVIVHPGYAIDCCGRDIVACEPVSFDVSGACPPLECLEPEFNRWGEVLPAGKNQGGGQTAYTKARAEAEMVVSSPLNLVSAEAEAVVSSPLNLLSGSVAFDLYVQYQAEDTDLQAVLRRDACGQAGECEASRIKESFTISLQSATEQEQREKQVILDWGTEYTKLKSKYKTLADVAYGKATRGEPLKMWLQDRMQTPPLEEFGFLRDWINAASESDLRTNLAAILLLLYQDAVNTWLRCGCLACQPDQGVPIARLWIAGRGAGRCRVLMVEDRSPYRRRMRLDRCYPAEKDCINLAQYLWLPWDTAREQMRAAGVRLGAKAYSEVSLDQLDLKSLNKIISARTISYCLQHEKPMEIQPMLVDMPAPWGKRVVGFGGQATEPSEEPSEEPSPDDVPMAVKIRLLQAAVVRPGDVIRFEYIVTNLGTEKLLYFELDSNLTGRHAYENLDPGQTYRSPSLEYQIPAGAKGQLVNTVTAHGQPETGPRTKPVKDTYTIDLVEDPVLEMGLVVRACANVAAARPRDIVIYDFEIYPIGNTRLDVTMTVDTSTFSKHYDDMTTPAYESFEVCVPYNARGELKTTITAYGISDPNNEPTEAKYTDTLRIVRP